MTPNFTAEQREIIETMYHHGSVEEFLEGMSHYIRDPESLPAVNYLEGDTDDPCVS